MTLLIIIHLLGAISERQMPSMEYCERLIAGIPRDKMGLLYCISVGAGYTPLVDYSPDLPDDMPAFSPPPPSLRIQPIPPSKRELFREYIHRIKHLTP
jgi:hypothetical protein